ncbi:MAG: hypothetical protein SFY66_18410 [Oculatellaceae cyanobacterium bins.114]|nr:hypothetical protein [Oculatellaceae cyanobacterium bins.114]
MKGQDIQPEEVYIVDPANAEVRQSSPVNPRISKKSLESPEEAVR